MFDVVCEKVAKAAEASLRLHKETFKRWIAVWPGEPAPAGSSAQRAEQFESTWADFCEDVLHKQWEAWAVQFERGLRNLEDASRVASGAVELWWRIFEPMQLLSVPKALGAAGDAPAPEALERFALEQAKRGLPPPRQVYDVENRSRIDWSRFPCWARPSDPEHFEGGHEG